jgi:hypothetical protein
MRGVRREIENNIMILIVDLKIDRLVALMPVEY